MTLGELLQRARSRRVAPTGTLQGRCLICQRLTDCGIPPRKTVSANFTAWSQFLGGNCFCPICVELLSDDIYRKKSWVVSLKDGFKTFPNDEALAHLLDPPTPPFFLHIAKRGHKQTWLAALYKINYSRDSYFFTYEPIDTPILFDRTRAGLMIDTMKILLEAKIPKREIRAGITEPSAVKKLMSLNGWEDIYKRLQIWRYDPLWEVIVDVTRA